MSNKNRFWLLTTLVVQGICIPQGDAELVQSAGNMQFTGELVNAPCVVDLRSQHQVVVMGQIKETDLRSPGEWSGTTTFQIRLEDCDTSVRTTASAAFSGTPDINDPTVFQTGSGRYPAQKVGLGIFDVKGNQLVPNSSPLSFQTLNDGVTILHYSAKYRATGVNVVPGDASAAVNFAVLYQ